MSFRRVGFSSIVRVGSLQAGSVVSDGCETSSFEYWLYAGVHRSTDIDRDGRVVY